MKNAYRYQVNFSKRFTTGILRGRLYHDYLRFTDWKTADAFRTLCESGHEFEPVAGNAAYRVEDVTLSAIETMMEAR